jgi:hypothetical protein
MGKRKFGFIGYGVDWSEVLRFLLAVGVVARSVLSSLAIVESGGGIVLCSWFRIRRPGQGLTTVNARQIAIRQ